MAEFTFLVLIFCSVFLIAQVISRLIMGRTVFAGQHAEHAFDEDPVRSNHITRILRDDRYSQIHTVDIWLKKNRFSRHLHNLIKQAGITKKTDFFVLTIFLMVICGVLIGQSAGATAWVMVLLGIGFGALPYLWLYYQKAKRKNLIDQQLPAALDMISRAMQAGHSFINALSLTGKESPHPIGAEFSLAADEINFGISTKDALSAMANRIDSMDIRYFVLAVFIHGQMGGKLTDLLLSLAQLIRERQRLRKTVKALSAEGRLSAWILGALPFAVGLGIYVVNPEFVSLLWNTQLGWQMTQGAFVAMGFGVLWMIKIIHIKI
jgi:tight adherence protein B